MKVGYIALLCELKMNFVSLYEYSRSSHEILVIDVSQLFHYVNKVQLNFSWAIL